MDSHFANNLKYLCSRSRSVSAVCRDIGINRQQFGRYLSGNAVPSAYTLRRIANGFGLSTDDLIFTKLDDDAYEKLPVQLRGSPLKLIEETFPGDISKLRSLVGYHHMHFLVPESPATVFRSLLYVYEQAGKMFTKTVERSTGRNGAIVDVAKYEGFLAYLGNLILLIELETLSREAVVETVIFPSQKRGGDLVTGLTLGITSEPYRMPFASPIALKFLGASVDFRKALSSCGEFRKDDRQIDPRIRKFFNTGGYQTAINANPAW